MALVPRPDESSRRSAPLKRQAAVERLGLALPVTPGDVKQAYFQKARDAHPDRGGSAADFHEVQRAFEEALEYAKRNGKRLPWLGAQMPVYVAQRDAINLVEGCGGTYFMERVDWLAGTVGEDFAAMADKLTTVDVSGRPFGDRELAALTAEPGNLPHLESLSLADTPVTDASAARLAKLPALRRLDLRGTEISFALRKKLARLPNMERVEGSSRVTEFLRGRRR